MYEITKVTTQYYAFEFLRESKDENGKKLKIYVEII